MLGLNMALNDNILFDLLQFIDLFLGKISDDFF